MTPLDEAHAAMVADETDTAARLRFFDRLAGSELVLLLEAEPTGDRISPRIFPVEDKTFVLAFDRDDRLTEFAGGSAPYAALSGRVLAEMLTGQDLGLGLNLGVAPSSILLEPDALSWLAQVLAERPEETEDRPEELSAPAGVPDGLLQALDTRLAAAAGLAHLAYLAGVTYSGGRRGHLLAFIDPLPGAEPALARSVGAALTFSGIEAGSLDVAFFRASDPLAARLAKVGLQIDLPAPPVEPAQSGAAPGTDPDRPPRLR